MTLAIRSVCCFLLILVWAVSPVCCGADQPKADPHSPVEKSTVLKWVKDYRQKQVLFNDADLEKLQQRLSDETPEAVRRWWTKTAEIREALESPQWQTTREWLREFLKVQAIYSDEQIAEIRQQAKDAVEQDSPQEFKDILARIEGLRRDLIQSSADSRALREHQLNVIRAFREEDEAARTAAASYNRNPVPQPPAQARPRRFTPAPLIDSLDVARWSVMRGFWGY